MSNVTRNDNGTIDIKIRLPWADIDAAYNKQVDSAVAEAELPGFRKGKAPREMVEPKLDKSALMSQALGEVLPPVYSKTIEAEGLKPILYPQIKIESGTTGQDWEFLATTCEAPAVAIPENWKDSVKNLKKPEKDEEKLGVVIEELRKLAKVQIPAMLLDEETNHRLSGLAENLSQLGLDMQKYLQTKKITPETLREQTAQAAQIDLEVEFLLNHIKNAENLADRAKTLEFLQNLI